MPRIPPWSGSGWSARAPGGDHFERSDIDLTIEAPAINPGEWAKLHLDLEEEADTLLLIEFVLMDDLPESFRRRVHPEGQLLYER